MVTISSTLNAIGVSRNWGTTPTRRARSEAAIVPISRPKRRTVPRQYHYWNDGRDFSIVSTERLETYVEKLRREGFQAPDGGQQ